MTSFNTLTGTAKPWRMPELVVPPPTARALEDITTAAREEGFQSGHADGVARGLEEARAIVQRLTSVLDQLARPLAAVDAEVERLVVGLSLQIGGQLAMRELKADPALVATIVQQAVGMLTPAPRDIRVRLHPQDLAAVQSVLAPGAGPNWQLQPDPKLARGDCVVETENAMVDARLQQRVAEVARQLFNE
jgi:flagellar assembly protein FliH